jgi:hypothetical protein
MGKLIFVIIVAYSATLFIINSRKDRKLWSRAAESLELPLVSAHEIAGSRSGHSVQVYRTGEGVGIRIDCRGKIPTGLRLDAERSLFQRVATEDLTDMPIIKDLITKRPVIKGLIGRSSNEAVTGDADFDRKAQVLGPEPYVQAILDSSTRAQVLREVFSFGATVADGQIVRTCRQLGGAVVAVPELIELAERLALPEQEIPERLAQNALTDPVAGVQLRSLRVLIDRFAGQDIVTTTCRQVLDDLPESELRLEAACYLRKDGLDELCDLALKSQVDTDLRVRAAQHLSQGSWAERSAPTLSALLNRSSAPKELLQAAIEGLGRLRDAAAVPRLLEMAEQADPLLSPAIAVALGRIGDPSGEPGLIALLAAGDSRAQIAAAGALGHMGTAAAVEPLLEMTKGLLSRSLKQEARKAIASIQERLTGAEVGQLSVAVVAELEGALSQDQSRTGELSLNSAAEPA